MNKIKERYERWKKRSVFQKAIDIAFWLLLLLLIIPGPRKAIVTGVNKVMLHIRQPSVAGEKNQVELDRSDYAWKYRDSEGLTRSFADHQGSVVFLNFWATWCPPCIAEMPEIQEIYEQYGDRVTFLLLTNQSPSEVEPFMKRHGYDLPVSYTQGGVPDVFRSRSIPTTYILSKDGRIVRKITGAADWNSRSSRSMFDQLLDQEVLR